MSQKTKTIIKETEEVSERDNPAVLAYRVGQLEIAMKDAALAQRESTESHKEGVKELVTKMDTYAMNFATTADLEAAIKQKEIDHQRFDERLDVVEKRTENADLVKRLVFGMVTLILVAFASAVVAFFIRGQAG